MGGISVVATSVAGIITTIVMGAQNAIKRGARATSKFAKTLAKIAEKAAPVLGAPKPSRKGPNVGCEGSRVFVGTPLDSSRCHSVRVV